MFNISGRKAAMPFLLSAALLAVATTGCKVDKTQDGKMPEVEVKGGQIPKYDVKGPTVEVGTKTKEINVPTDVKVTTEKKEIKLPEISVTPPK